MVARSMPRVAQRILDARGFLRSPYAMEPLSLTHSAKGCLSMTKVSADIPSVGFASPNLVQEGWRGGGLERHQCRFVKWLLRIKKNTAGKIEKYKA